jgi:hypothetical protein
VGNAHTNRNEEIIMKKAAYMAEMEERLTQYSAQLAQMRTKGLQVQTDMQGQYLSRVKLLEDQRDKLKATYGQLKEAGVGAWEDVKDGTEKAFADFKAAFDKAKNRFMF